VEKNSIATVPVIDTIFFSYSDQTNFTPTGGNNTDFDCEAFIVTSDSIFLFSKQWVSNETSVYALPKIPGTYVAQLKNTLNVQGLITGSTYVQANNLLVLSGYSNVVQPFVYLLYDFQGTDFFDGNKRKITVSLPFHQIEGISTVDGIKYYMSNELLVQAPIINIPQKLHVFDFSAFLFDYLNPPVSISEIEIPNEFTVFPVPAGYLLNVKHGSEVFFTDFRLINQSGQIVMTGKLSSENPEINIGELPAGVYFLKLGFQGATFVRIIKG
jgi:hypothetical protein